MYRITQVLSVGRFLTPARVQEASNHGITHVLNVSDYSNLIAAGSGTLTEVVSHPLTDNCRIPERKLSLILTDLHRIATIPDSHVYIHCLAGQQRSPNVLWLYLISLGIDPRSAQHWIERRSPDAVPGHHLLVDADLILFAQKYGAEHLLPLTRAAIVLPAM